ncbi:MAG: DUF3108 domain-containing protein [Alphaproteobacteria bacterium]|nr:DUF3108 domain-containing protein [Alphaproteobacteria bacterium]
MAFRTRLASSIVALSLTVLVPGSLPAHTSSLDNAPVTGGFDLSAVYSGSVLIFEVGEISLRTRVEPDRYEAQSMIEASGLVALFTDFEIRSEVEGRLDEGGFIAPDRYAHIERTGDKVREVEVSFDTGVAQSDVTPPFGSWGVPPASEEDRRGTIDPMTAFLGLSNAIALDPDRGCAGSLPVFDGKARYNLNLQSGGFEPVRTRAWRGDALVCQAWYEPISGYDPEDYPSEDELEHPLTIWLAPVQDGAYYLPVRLHTRAGLGGVTIEAVEITINS